MKTIIFMPLLGCLIILGIIDTNENLKEQEALKKASNYNFTISKEEIESERHKFEMKMLEFDNLFLKSK